MGPLWATAGFVATGDSSCGGLSGSAGIVIADSPGCSGAVISADVLMWSSLVTLMLRGS